MEGNHRQKDAPMADEQFVRAHIQGEHRDTEQKAEMGPESSLEIEASGCETRKSLQDARQRSRITRFEHLQADIGHNISE